VKLGVFLPTYLVPATERDHAEQIRRFAVHAEELGFESLFVTDHLLTAHRFYRVSWLDPLTTLAHVASVTTSVKLGTSILVLPVRQPVVLAKEVATLQYLSGGRYIFGVGVGWYGPEFEAVGARHEQRGRRTDEVLEACIRLLGGSNVTYEGRYYRFNDITVEPLTRRPPVWVAGGRQFAHEASPEQPVMAATVLRRICRWDGWIARPTATPEQIRDDLAEIDDELERQGTSRAERGFTVAHENFCWLSESASRERAVAEQDEAMRRVVSDARPWSYLDAVFLTGTIDEIQQGVQNRIDAGVEHLFLHTMTADLRQLDLFAKHILEPFALADRALHV
jgi:probable F420-dependent oxidoreductase